MGLGAIFRGTLCVWSWLANRTDKTAYQQRLHYCEKKHYADTTPWTVVLIRVNSTSSRPPAHALSAKPSTHSRHLVIFLLTWKVAFCVQLINSSWLSEILQWITRHRHARRNRRGTEGRTGGSPSEPPILRWVPPRAFVLTSARLYPFLTHFLPLLFNSTELQPDPEKSSVLHSVVSPS